MDISPRNGSLCTPALVASMFSLACDSSAPSAGAQKQVPAEASAQKQAPTDAGASAGARVEDFPGTYQGAEKLARALMKPGGDLALTQALKPRAEDYALVFEAPAVDAIRTGFEPIWASMNAVGAMDGQTELRLVSATSDELRKGTEVFPGYAPMLMYLRPGFTWYRFKFVRPGESTGKEYDGLVHVKDHWALFPEPWRHVPASIRPSEGDCKKFSDHFASLMVRGQEGPAAEITKQVADGMKGDLIKECVEKGTAAEIACALAADSMEAVEKCGSRK